MPASTTTTAAVVGKKKTAHGRAKVDSETHATQAARFPTATLGEYERFRHYRHELPSNREWQAHLRAYLNWRDTFQLDSIPTTIEHENDAAAWDFAVEHALDINIKLQAAGHGEETAAADNSARSKSRANDDNSTASVSSSSQQRATDDSVVENNNDDDGDEDADRRHHRGSLFRQSRSKASTTKKSWRNPLLLPRHNKHRTSPDLCRSSSFRAYDFPQLLFAHCIDNSRHVYRDQAGNMVLHVLPAQIDLAHDVQDYVSILAVYLDQQLGRDGDDQVTLVVDVRPGLGWPNPPALSMLAFVRQVSHALSAKFPGRLAQVVLFPVPKVAIMLYHMFQGLLSKSLVEKVRLVPGSCTSITSPTPTNELAQYIGAEGLRLMESARQAAFVPSEVV